MPLNHSVGLNLVAPAVACHLFFICAESLNIKKKQWFSPANTADLQIFNQTSASGVQGRDLNFLISMTDDLSFHSFQTVFVVNHYAAFSIINHEFPRNE